MFQLRTWSRATEGSRRGVEDPARRPVIIANPPGDRAFREMIDSALLSDTLRPHDLEAFLRTRYPNAVVRPRELDAERVEVWYVYRDGHWIRSERDVGI